MTNVNEALPDGNSTYYACDEIPLSAFRAGSPPSAEIPLDRISAAGMVAGLNSGPPSLGSLAYMTPAITSDRTKLGTIMA